MELVMEGRAGRRGDGQRVGGGIGRSPGRPWDPGLGKQVDAVGSSVCVIFVAPGHLHIHCL